MRIFSLTPTIPSIFFLRSLICFDSNLLYLYRLLKYTLLNICYFLWHYAFNNNEWMSNPLNASTICVVILFRIGWRRWNFSFRSCELWIHLPNFSRSNNLASKLKLNSISFDISLFALDKFENWNRAWNKLDFVRKSVVGYPVFTGESPVSDSCKPHFFLICEGFPSLKVNFCSWWKSLFKPLNWMAMIIIYNSANRKKRNYFQIIFPSPFGYQSTKTTAAIWQIYVPISILAKKRL